MKSGIKKAMKNGEPEKALHLIEEMESKNQLTADLLVAKGQCIQLTKDASYDLDDAQKAFQLALDIDPNYVDASIELAYYYYTVEDDAKTGKKYFDLAFDRSKRLMIDSIVGQAKCISELTSNKDAVDFLVKSNFSEEEEVSLLISELSW